MPYGYYQFVRFAGLVGFTILAYKAQEQGRQTEMIVCAGLALLFQPFFKIANNGFGLGEGRNFQNTKIQI